MISSNFIPVILFPMNFLGCHDSHVLGVSPTVCCQFFFILGECYVVAREMEGRTPTFFIGRKCWYSFENMNYNEVQFFLLFFVAFIQLFFNFKLFSFVLMCCIYVLIFHCLCLYLLKWNLSVTAIECYQCSSRDHDNPFQCNEYMTDDIDIEPKSCDDVFEAAYCIKQTGRFEGLILLFYLSSFWLK